MENKRRPCQPFAPCAAYARPPLIAMYGAHANVSTLLTSVGKSSNPFVSNFGGMLRGSPRRSDIASINALCSPQIYPPGLTNTEIGNGRPSSDAVSPQN